MFKTREARKFRRISIYTDERRDKLAKIIEDVKREKGELPPKEYNASEERFKGKFSEFTPRTQRFTEGGRGLIKWPVALILIIMLLWFIRWLMTGDIRF